MDFFYFKKLIGIFIMPLPFVILILVIGLFLLFRKRLRSGTFTVLFATVCLLIFSLPMLPNALLRPLEMSYPQFDMSVPVSQIVVLGCRHVNDRRLPITAQLAPCSVVRASEAIRIYQRNPNATIITSGNVGVEPFSNAYMTKQFLLAMGVPPTKIIENEKSKDTEEEAINLANLVKQGNFALVTSASHMKRAMALFESQKLHPIAAPTHHFVKQSDIEAFSPIFPSADNLDRLERWWYEAMGNTWIWLKSLW